jgi:hypothetical protein
MISFPLTFLGLYSFGAPCGVNGFVEKVLVKKIQVMAIPTFPTPWTPTRRKVSTG